MPGNKSTVPAYVPALTLNQRHYFIGNTNLIVSKAGMRMATKGSFGFTVVARAPDWTVTVFRDDDRSYFSEPFSVFEESGVFSNFLYSRRERVLENRNKPVQFVFDGQKALRAGDPHRYAEYIPASPMCPPQAEKLLFAIYKMPTNYGLPLKFVYIAVGRDLFTDKSTKGSLVTGLITYNCKASNVPLSIFDPPAGYKKAASVREVVSGKKSREESKDFQDLFH